jgi:hypothetical protein
MVGVLYAGQGRTVSNSIAEDPFLSRYSSGLIALSVLKAEQLTGTKASAQNV